MRNFTTQDFEKYFFDLIENSFFEQEKKDFFSAIKTLNISQKELMSYLFEEFNKLTTQNDESIELTIKHLPKSTLIHKITTQIEKGELRYLNAADVLYKSLNAAFVIFMQDLKKIDKTLYDSSISTMEKNKELIRGRFNYDESKTLVEEKFNGQLSFILKKGISASSTLEILKKLKQYNLVDTSTSASKFQKIFSGGKILNDEKVDWTGTKHELSLFVKGLKPKLRIDSNIYDTTLRCFTIKSKEIIKIEEISKSQISKGISPKSQILKDIISHF
jgi:hypothetical protein